MNCVHYIQLTKFYVGLSLFCFFSNYFSFQQFFFLTYFAQYVATIFLFIKGFPGVSPAIEHADCCIRVIHNMVTALLKYLDLLAVFSRSIILRRFFVSILVEYLHICDTKS